MYLYLKSALKHFLSPLLEDKVGITSLDYNPLEARTDKICGAFSWPLATSVVLSSVPERSANIC